MKRVINEVNWQGDRYIMEWFSDVNYDSLKNITKVYGVLFDDNGKICVIGLVEENKWSLPGGDIEKGETWKQALIREADEEADIEINEKTITALGYIKVSPKNKDNPVGVHYLLRVAGKISKVKEQILDPDTNKMNDRVFISPEEFPRYCHWGKMGDVLIEKAEEAWKDLK